MAIVVRMNLPPAEAHPNGRSHWRRRASAVATYRKSCGELAWATRHELAGTVACPIDVAAIGLAYHFAPAARGTRLRGHDPDNLIAWAKAAIDGLVDGGILADDRQLVYLPPTTQLTDVMSRLEVSIQTDGICPLCGGAGRFSLIR